jgi:hypothetical protein
MAALLDQLHYTWALRGVEGSNQFQIAAMSAGFKAGPAAAALSMVERLCRYDPPRGKRSELPISFGWLDDEGYRIAFRRIGVPAEKGKQGNFAAHFLVGPVTELSEAAIATLFGSPFWWNGLDSEGIEAEYNRERRFELPQLLLADLPVAGPPDEVSVRAGQALLYGIFNQPPGTRIAVTAPAEELGAAIKAAGQFAPEALWGLSFSTYEGEPIFPFDIVGGAGAGSDVIHMSLELPSDFDQLSGLTLDALRDEGGLSGVAAQASGRHGGSGSSDIWEAARRIVSLSQDGAGAGEEALGLLAEPVVVRLVCGAGAGRSAVIAAVQAGSHEVATALRTAGAEMDPTEVAELCSEIADRYRTTRDLRGCGIFAAVFGSAAGGVLDIALDLALEEERAAEDLRGNDAAALLVRAAERSIDVAAARPLLRGLRKHAVFCAKTQQVPNYYLAAMFEFGLSDPVAADRLGDVVRARPALLSELQLDGTENDRCRDILRPLIFSLGPAVAGRCVIGIPLRPDQAEMPPALSQLCDELAAELLLARKQPLACQVLERSNSSDARHSLQVLRDDSHRPREILDMAIRGSSEVRLVALREAVMGFALARAVTAVDAPPDVTAIWEALETCYPSENQLTQLRQLLMLAEEHGTEVTVAELLAWVALVKAPASSELISRLGRIRDNEVDELSLKLAHRVSAAALSSQDEFVKDANRRSRKWWKRLRKQRRKGR